MTNLDEVVRYPAGITPHGEYHLLNGQVPSMHFHAHDGSIDFRMLGGLAAPFSDPQQPAVVVKSLKGLVAPWQFVDQKGATQHGVTTVANLFDPIEVTAECELIGDDRKALRELVRAWIASNEHMKTGELSFTTPELGRWWAPLRWYKTPPNSILLALLRRQPFTQVWRADNSFWRSYDSIDSFRLLYNTDIDYFGYVAPDLGEDWDVAYSGTGGAYIYADGNQAAWEDDPGDPVLSGGRDAVCRRAGFETDSDNQVVSTGLSNFITWQYPDLAEHHLWGRMKMTGDAGDTGVRLAITATSMRLSYFIDGVETVLREQAYPFPPWPYEIFTLVCGYEGNPRLFKVFRGGAEVMSVIESGAGSMTGEDYRGAGFGVHAGPSATPSRSTPAPVLFWSAGDNNPTGSRSGFIKLTNVGDQPMPPRYTCFGPGTFRFANGPGSTDYVQFGPLLPNQIMQVNTDAEQRPVVDMTSIPPTPQELTFFQRALNDFINFATAGNVPPLLQQIKSMNGIVPPQGHPYSLLSGSFSNPIPAKSPGKPAQTQYISVSITGGNADSMILAAGTPLRRYPL